MIRFSSLLLLLACTPAAAQPQATLPTHDVTITYRVQGAARDLLPGMSMSTVRLAWSAAGQRLRVEPEDGTGYALVDLRRGTAMLVDAGLHSAVALPVRPGDLDPLRLHDARLEPRGPATVAGRACTDYAVQSRRGAGTVCLAADGVALRGQGSVDGRAGSFTALAVVDGPLAAALFAPPEGFFRLALPPGFALPPRLRLPP